ncbi:hypothetical protein HDA36_004666 [Nocardiopsis composta]|uniref:Uncharacterized protein n=1 Tax=Nocardiopsis composta TaxID=157465 RepID=A0A7W8QQ64_9ACTN|nr:hypothetical protein [Nocardiopsis composta]
MTRRAAGPPATARGAPGPAPHARKQRQPRQHTSTREGQR